MNDNLCPKCGGVLVYKDDINTESPSIEGEWHCLRCGRVFSDTDLNDDDYDDEYEYEDGTA